MESDRRGAKQTKYQVMVASTGAGLAAGEADLWDSGPVDSDRTFDVRYDGKPLQFGHRYHWKLRVWDENGTASPWSQPAVWAMGLPPGEDWTANWIGLDASRERVNEPAPLKGAKWITHDSVPLKEKPAGLELFVTRIDLPTSDRVAEATVYAAGDNLFHLAVNGKMVVHGEPGWKKIKPVSIADMLTPGTNELRFQVTNTEIGPTALIAKVLIRLESGKQIIRTSEGGWLSCDAPGHHWPGRPLGDEELSPCRVVGDYGIDPWNEATVQGLHLPPVPLLRGEFTTRGPVTQATLHASALGIVDAYLNGQRVSDEYFSPGWSDYTQRVYYRTWDVTSRVKSGANALGAELADGWYSGYIGWGRNRDLYGEKPRTRLQLRLVYEDGSIETIGTDSEWRAIEGPAREADFLMGQRHDARLEQAGWSEPGFDDSDWKSVDVGVEGEFLVEPHPGPPVVAIEEFEPVEITQPEPDVYVLDLGQNFAGVTRLTITGETGQEVRLRFGERLNPDGTLYTTNLRGARAEDTFICSGGQETWTPRFTFHGFQYVEVTGLKSPPTEETITGIALSSQTPDAGSFECSEPMLNRLVENIYWTQRSNFIDVPTDCPQRDERLGWTGDAQVYVATACLHADVQAFFRKWLVDLTDGQREDGQFPMVAPLKVAGDDGGPAWADAGVICPWEIYRAYGDRDLLRRQYPSMKRFVEFCRKQSRDGVLPPEEFHCFGDWLSVNADTPHEVIYTAYYAYSTQLLAKAAEALGETADAASYREHADHIATAFREEFVAEDGRIRGDTQCGYVLALQFDLLNDQQAELAATHLVKDIEQRKNHLSTGFIGTKDLMLALAKIGRNDVACRLIHQTSYPSWGFSIQQGATSIWERWDGWTPDQGFQDPGMNSFAHYSFGAVYQWMVENLAGICNDANAYQQIAIEPVFDERLRYARTHYDSIRGRVATDWQRTAEGIDLKVTVPPNCVATIALPTASIRDVREGNQNLTKAAGVSEVTVANGKVTARIQSGVYVFHLPTD